MAYRALPLKREKKDSDKSVNSDFWRGYTSQERSAKSTGKCPNFEEQKSLPEFKLL